MSRENRHLWNVTPPGEFAWLQASDGVRLRYARFAREDTPPGRAIVFQTGRTEFIEKYFEAVHDLLDRGFTVYMMDWRGQGLSDRALAERHKGHIRDYALYVSDFAEFMTRVVLPDASGPVPLLAHSMGAHITYRYMHDHQDQFTHAIFSGPMFDIRFPRGSRTIFSAIVRTLAALGLSERWIGPNGAWDPDAPFEGNVLTSDAERYADYGALCGENPDLAIGAPTVGWLVESLRSIALLGRRGHAEAVQTPVLIVWGTDDTLVSQAAIRKIVDRLPDARSLVVEGARHEVLKERDVYQELLWEAFDEFVGAQGT